MNMIAKIRSAISRELPLFMALPAFVWQLLFLYVPLACVVGISFLPANNESLFLGFNVNNYAPFIDPIYWAIIGRSLFLGVTVALTCAIIAYPVAYYVALYASRWKYVCIFFLILPFWTNLLVQVYAWFFVLEKNGLLNTVLLRLGLIAAPLRFLNTPFAVFLVMVYCYLPFMVMPIYSVLERFNKRLIEASFDLGATSWQTLIRVTLPLSLPGLRTGFFLVLVPSFGEYVIPVLTGGGKQLYVGSLISHYFLTALDVQTGAAFTCLSAMVLLVASVFLYWLSGKLFPVSGGGK